jgi:hypothetical protein
MGRKRGKPGFAWAWAVWQPIRAAPTHPVFSGAAKLNCPGPFFLGLFFWLSRHAPVFADLMQQKDERGPTLLNFLAKYEEKYEAHSP